MAHFTRRGPQFIHSRRRVANTLPQIETGQLGTYTSIGNTSEMQDAAHTNSSVASRASSL
jgi:hypothetical protein